MKNPARLGWLVAILLALSLIAPFSSASAAQADGTPTAVPSESVTPTPETPVAQPTEIAVESPTETVEEPVIPAALGDLKLYSKDAANADLPGATYAIYDGATCVTTLLAGPTAADQFGTVTFTGVAAQGTQVCVVITVTPSGYLVPDPLVLTLSTETVLTQWSITFVAAPAQTYDLPIFKEDRETGAKLGGAGFTVYVNACPGGEIIRDEQFTGDASAVDGSAGRTIFEDLPAGTYCVVETTAPSGYTGGGSATVALPDNASGWTFQNDPVVVTYDLPIFKEDVETGAKLGGAGITLYEGDCDADGDLARAEQFTGDASAVDGSAGRTIFTGLVAGDYCAVETTAPEGYSGGASANVNLPDDTSGWTLGNTALEPELYDLPIFKEDSQTGAKLGGAGFTVFYEACTEDGGPVGPEQFTGPADATDGSAGRTIFEDLAAGTYCVVEVTPPDGYYRAGPVTVNLPENASGWTFLNDPMEEVGSLEVTKYFCAVASAAEAGTYFNQNPGADDCILGAASFRTWNILDDEYVWTFSTDSESGTASLALDPGNYILQEISSGAQVQYTIVDGEVTEIPVYNLTYGEGSLYVTKIFCKAKYDTTDISFDYPVDVDAAGWDGHHKPKCWQGDAHFEIWLHGDANDAISFDTGKDGEAWLILPVTDGNPHKLVETDTGAWSWFDIYEDQITYATVTNYFKAHHPWRPTVTPVPTSTGTGSVTSLPATGSGSSGNGAWFLLGIAVVGITGLAGIALRRKPMSR